jgi:SPX domain protein involved in polyphosphate accumulation
LKGKIKDITAYREQLETSNVKEQRTVEEQRKKLCESAQEVEFFRCLKKELKKVSAFFSTSETLCNIRRGRLWDGLAMLKRKQEYHQDHAAWTRMLAACIRFYKDVLFLENYAIMNYCGFSKILKKHDKRTG